ncbi:FUSC family protein [Komagataeibacter kakiaceti]|uniref:FUSC family protein n=1 Tax=Komagataeibacter kakiaceti TaxID=943261 RepID=UPI000AC6F22F|nr:FUSC family protein [Komagataeibacter kakiaceti]
MTIGLNVIRLRAILERHLLPPDAQRVVSDMMGRMAQFSGRYGGHYGRTARSAKFAIVHLQQMAGLADNLGVRLEIDSALICMYVISYELDHNEKFFDASSPYLDPVMA